MQSWEKVVYNDMQIDPQNTSFHTLYKCMLSSVFGSVDQFRVALCNNIDAVSY